MNDRTKPEDLPVTGNDIDEAWQRLYMKIKHEQPSEAWEAPSNKVVTLHAGSAEAAGASPASELHSPDIPGLRQTAGQDAADEPATSAQKSYRRSRTGAMLRRWGSLASAALLAGLLLFSPWGQDVMAAMMSTFRVQQLETVSISSTDLQQLAQGIEQGVSGTRELDLKQYGEFEQQGGPASIVDLQTAASTAGHSLKVLPGADTDNIRYKPEQKLTFKLHTKSINKMIALLGGHSFLPNAADGEPLRLTIPGSYSMHLSSGDATGDNASFKQLEQLPIPVLDVPSGIDPDEVRAAVLDLPVLPDSLRSQLAAIGDWRHTLPVPTISEVDGLSIRDVTVNGSNAAVFQTPEGRKLVWLEKDWAYTLTGSLNDYPSDRSIVDEAEGLMNE